MYGNFPQKSKQSRNTENNICSDLCGKLLHIFSLRLRIFASNFMKNTYFYELGRGPFMGPKYVGTKILADLGSAIMWSSILH